jgi:tetratricopeptide (TPR) repeat protein
MMPSDADMPPRPEGPEITEPARIFKPVHYIKAARTHLKNGRQKAAYGILLRAVVLYPEEPLILSYCGCLQAIVDKKYRSGVETCRKAIVLFKPEDAYTAGVIYPVLYLNLGRAYLAAGRKRDAIEAFSRGRKFDRSHTEIKKELHLLGIRKELPVPFLSRSNPINKYIGLLLHRSDKARKVST